VCEIPAKNVSEYEQFKILLQIENIACLAIDALVYTAGNTASGRHKIQDSLNRKNAATPKKGRGTLLFCKTPMPTAWYLHNEQYTGVF